MRQSLRNRSKFIFRKKNLYGRFLLSDLEMFSSTSEYVSIVNMLLNQSERYNVELRALLYLITPYIADKLHAKTCTDRFFEQDIITVSDKDEIQCIQHRSGEIAAMRVLLDKVPRKSPKWDTALADVLRENELNDIANLFSLHGDNNAQPCAKTGNEIDLFT